tara:strand:- start:154 stop:564 length:411 start_codon:yes stop_codon:yes gene_type:complete
MKVLTSQETFALKNQLAVIREQMTQIEERGVYDVAGNTVKASDRKEYQNLVMMENHVRQLAAGIEKPLPLKPKERPGVVFRERVSDERWEELYNLAHEAFKDILGCTDTRNGKESPDGIVAAQETCNGGRGQVDES